MKRLCRSTLLSPKGLKVFSKGFLGKVERSDVSSSTSSFERVCKERKKRKLTAVTELSAFRECVSSPFGLVENKIRTKLYGKFLAFDWLPFSSVGQCVDAELIAKDVPRTPGVECLAKFDILSIMAAMTYHCGYGYMQGHLEILRDLEKSVGLSAQAIEFVLAKFPLGYVDDVFREAERYTVDVLKSSWESEYFCGEISTCVGSFVSRCSMTEELKMCFLDLLMIFDSKLISCVLVAANEERMNVVKEISEFSEYFKQDKPTFEKIVNIPVDWIFVYHRVLKLLECMDLDYHIVEEALDETHVDSVKSKSWKGSMRSLSSSTSASSLRSDSTTKSDSRVKPDNVDDNVDVMESIAEESDSLSLVSSASSVSSIFICGDSMTTDALKDRLPLDKKRGKYVNVADWFALPDGVKLVCVFSKVRSVTKRRPYIGHALEEKFGLSKPKFRTRLGELYAVDGDWRGYCFDCQGLRVIVVEMGDRDIVESVFEDFVQWLPASVALTAFEFECAVNGILCLDAIRRNPRQCVFIQYRSNTFSALVAAMVPIDPSKPDEVPIDVFPALGNMDGTRTPEYIECVDKLDYFRNSMIEYRHIERLTTEHILSRFDWLKEVLKDDFAGVNEYVINRLEKERMNIYDNEQGFNLFGGYSYICMYGLTEDGLVEYLQEDHRFVTSRRYVAYGKEFEILLSDKVADRLNHYDILNVRLPEIDWVNGPPGCGKTHEILSRVEASKFNSGKEMILCMTKQGVVDVAERLSEKKGIKPNGLKKGVRTVMSVLVNGCDRKLDKVYDEALMSHAGSIAFVAVITQCEMLFLIGDVNQIPFIDRLHICPVRFGSMSGFAVVTRVLKASYRCPVDVVYALRDFYPGIYSMSSVVVSMRLRSYTHDITEIDKNAKNTLFLTHMQADKDQMIVDGYGRGSGSKVMTVEERMNELSVNEKGLKARKKRDERPSVMTPHEAQGLTYDHVICIRRSVKPLKIFDSEPHAIVTISRHRKTFTYYTDVNDAVARLVQNVTDRDTMLRYNEVMKGAHNLTAGFAEDYHQGGRRVFLDERESVFEDAVVGLPFFSHRCERVSIEKGESFMLSKKPFAPLPKVEPDLAYLQTWYDDKIGESASVSVAHDPELIEFSDLIVNVDREISLNPADGVPKRSRFDKLEPVLRTLVPSRRTNSLKESLLGAMKRNLNAPVLINEELSETKLAHYMVDNFINSAIPEDKMSLFESYKDNPIGIDARMVDEWLAKQPPAVRKLACSDTPAHLRSYNKFKFMIKNTVKPVMEAGAAWKYASVQTIVYNDKSVNAIFCPIFNAMSERLYAVLSEKIMILTNCSNEEFEREINRRFNIAYLKICQCVENDMSKYDKSQGEVLRIMEDLIFFLLGMPLWLIRIWSAAHRRTHLRDWLHGLYVSLENQRKSGDPSTFFGNTLVLLIILCVVYDLREILLMILAGDDSCLFLMPGATAFGYDPSSRVADFFNLECKLLDNYKVPYFCSKFLVFTDEWLYLVPDPLKVVTKLGRRDLVNDEHVEEYRVSCEDVLKPLFNSLVCEGLSVGVCERYGGFMSDCVNLCAVLKAIVTDKREFKKLFVAHNWMKLSKDVSRPKLDI
uniref:ORF2 n=1 Tax=Bemisia tabaci virga-like virus 1 TaxID=2766749 RepID=A0A7G8JUR9_9VIRU|nr:ORF2 [Bemisia tabaci virga-like virus 1]